MEPAPKTELPLRRMTWPEICDAYPDQWVVLGGVHRDTTRPIDGGVVLGCGRTMRESSARASVADGEHVALLYTGRLRSPRRW